MEEFVSGRPYVKPSRKQMVEIRRRRNPDSWNINQTQPTKIIDGRAYDPTPSPPKGIKRTGQQGNSLELEETTGKFVASDSAASSKLPTLSESPVKSMSPMIPQRSASVPLDPLPSLDPPLTNLHK